MGNEIIVALCTKLAILYHHASKTQQNYHIFWMSCLGQTFNQTISVALVHFWLLKDKDTVNSAHGIVSDCYAILTANASIMLMKYIVCSYYGCCCIKKCKQNRIKKSKNIESYKLLQFELNQQFENEPAHVIDLLARIFNMWFTALFYYPILPVAIWVCFVSLFLIYWLTKLGVICFYTRVPRYNDLVMYKIFKCCKMGTFWLALGYIITDEFLYHKVYPMSWVLLACSIIFICFLHDEIFPHINHNKEKSSYQDNLWKIYAEHQRANP